MGYLPIYGVDCDFYFFYKDDQNHQSIVLPGLLWLRKMSQLHYDSFDHKWLYWPISEFKAHFLIEREKEIENIN